MSFGFETISIEKIKQANEAIGHHWFEPGTMRWFNSRVSNVAYRGPGGTFFVSSERMDDTTPRLYSVRRANDDGSIDTVGEHQAYKSSAAATRVARRFAAEGVGDEAPNS